MGSPIIEFGLNDDIEEFPIEEFPIEDNVKRPKGKFVTTGRVTQWVPESPGPDLNNRRDRAIFSIGEPGAAAKFFDEARNKLSNQIALSEYIPEFAKPGLAALTSLSSEPARFLAEFLNEGVYPEDILAPSAVQPSRVLRTLKKTPELLVPKRQQLALPPASEISLPGRTRFIAGPGGVQERHLITPHEEARLAGYEPLDLGTPAQPSGSQMDLDYVRELRRQKALDYTQHEQLGGTSLELPETRMPIPAQAGDTRLGFESSSRSTLEYPLNVVPESVRPRSAQTVTRALAGDVVEEAPRSAKIKFEDEILPKAKKNLQTGIDEFDTKGGTAALRPDEPILPSAPSRLTRQASKNSTLNITPEIVATAPEELQRPLTALIVEEAKTPSPWRASSTVLGRLFPEGLRRTRQMRQLSRRYSARWAPAFENTVNKLSHTEKQNFGGYVEGSIPVTSPKVQDAVDAWRAIADEIGAEAEKIGLRMNDKELFQSLENYWRHIPTQKLESRGLVEALIQKGMSRSDANRVLNKYRKAGELFIGPQHHRDLASVIPYRLDAEVGLQHIRQMSKRMSEHVHFGPKDIKGTGSEGIADLIEELPISKSDKNMVIDIMERSLGRGDAPTPRLQRILDGSRKFSAITKLWNFALGGNITTGQLPTALHARPYPLQSIKEVAKLITSSSYRKELAKSGIWENLNYTMADEMSKFGRYNIPGKALSAAMSAGEMFNRGVAGSIGKVVARESHKLLRKTPSNKLARKELFDLVQEDVNKLISQDRLTEDQLNVAAGRLAEMTQSLSYSENIPHWASQPVKGYGDLAVQLGLIFKKTAFQVTKDIFDMINPRIVGTAAAGKNFAMLLASAGVIGEMTGDIKAGIGSLYTQDFDAENQKRIDRWLKGSGIGSQMIEEVSSTLGIEPELLARLLDNWSQSFMLGLPADMIMGSTYGPTGLLSSFAGPIYGDISKAAHRISTGDFKGLMKEILSSAPIPGARQMSDAILEDEN